MDNPVSKRNLVCIYHYTYFIWYSENFSSSATCSLINEQFNPSISEFPDAIIYNCEANDDQPGQSNIPDVTAIINYVNKQSKVDLTGITEKYEQYIEYCQAIESKLGFGEPYKSTISMEGNSFDVILNQMLGQQGMGMETTNEILDDNDDDQFDEHNGDDDLIRKIFVSKITCSKDSIELTPVYIKFYRKYQMYQKQNVRGFLSIGDYEHRKFILTNQDLFQIRKRLKIQNHRNDLFSMNSKFYSMNMKWLHLIWKYFNYFLLKFV